MNPLEKLKQNFGKIFAPSTPKTTGIQPPVAFNSSFATPKPPIMSTPQNPNPTGFIGPVKPPLIGPVQNPISTTTPKTSIVLPPTTPITPPTQPSYDIITGARTSYGESIGAKNMLGGKEVTSDGKNINASTGGVTEPTLTPEQQRQANAEKAYKDILSGGNEYGYASEDINQYETAFDKANKRLAEIQNEEDQANLNTRRDYTRELDTSGRYQSANEQAASVGLRRNNSNLADIALRELAAARTAGVAQQTLEQRMSRMQATRTASLEASKFALERADKALENATKESTTSSSGFTLQPGETRYDSKGNVVASGGPKPMTQAQETAAIAKTDKEEASQQSATQSIGIVNNLLAGDAYKGITGIGQNPFNAFGLSNASSLNQYNQLQGLLKLGIRGLLKGQGAVSDYEGRVLGQAATALGRNLSNEDFHQALLKIRGTLKTNNGMTTTVDVTNPNTGETINDAELSGDEIYKLVSEGNTIKYK